MNRISKLGFGAAVVVAGVSVAGVAAAQEAEGQAAAGGEVGMTLPGAGAPKAGAAQGESDHDAVIGTFGVGYMGRYQIPLIDNGNLSAPAVGVRYWLDQMIGIDAGVGFFSDGGSNKDDPGQTEDLAGRTAFLIHAGVPLSLASEKHFAFQIIPEVNVGLANQTEKLPNNGGEIKRSAFGFDVGARVGAEIQFGFMGIPKLSLTGAVGLLYSNYTTKRETKPNGGNTVTREESRNSITTTVNGQPWDIFTSSISALYYF